MYKINKIKLTFIKSLEFFLQISAKNHIYEKNIKNIIYNYLTKLTLLGGRGNALIIEVGGKSCH